jgi:hypothetical protein
MERKHYIFYNTTTGVITASRNLTESQAMKHCNANSNTGCMEGIVNNLNGYKIDTSTDPVSIVSNTDNMNINTPKPSCRLQRNGMLQGSDWTQAADSPLSDSKKAEWATYRQALRDLINGLDDDLATAEGVVWPTPPS